MCEGTSRAPLRVHISQADGRLLWWMYTPQLSLELVGWSKIPTATSSGTYWVGVVATIQGAWRVKTTFLPSPLHWTERSWVRTPWPATIFQMKFSILKADVLSRHANFPISLPSHATCSTPRTFLPSILPSSSSIFKQVADTYKNTEKLSYLSVLSNTHKAPSG